MFLSSCKKKIPSFVHLVLNHGLHRVIHLVPFPSEAYKCKSKLFTSLNFTIFSLLLLFPVLSTKEKIVSLVSVAVCYLHTAA